MDLTEDDIKRKMAALQDQQVELRVTKRAEESLAKTREVVAQAKDAMEQVQAQTEAIIVKVKSVEEALEAVINGHETVMLGQFCKMENTMTGIQDEIDACVQHQMVSTVQQQKDTAEMASLLEMVQGVADGAQKSIEAAQGIMRNATTDLEKLREVSTRLLRMTPDQGNGPAGAAAGAVTGAGVVVVGGGGRCAGATPGLLSLHGLVRQKKSLYRTGAMHFQLYAYASCVSALINCCTNTGSALGRWRA